MTQQTQTPAPRPAAPAPWAGYPPPNQSMQPYPPVPASPGPPKTVRERLLGARAIIGVALASLVLGGLGGVLLGRVSGDSDQSTGPGGPGGFGGGTGQRGGPGLGQQNGIQNGQQQPGGFGAQNGQQAQPGGTTQQAPTGN